MARKFHERRSVATALKTYLTGKGWNIPDVKEGFQSNDAVQPPLVSIYFLPSAFEELEMGRGEKKSFVRRVQIDAYMESENRAEAIGDDVMDFLDDTPVTISDTETSATIGYMLASSESITNETVPPIMKNPSVIRWRNVTKVTYESYYNL